MTVTVKPVKRVPLAVPGEGMAEIVRRATHWIKSNAIAYSESSGAINIIELPGNVVVVSALIHVSTVFDASGTSAAATATLTVPNDTGTETLWDANLTQLQSSGFHPASAIGKVPSSGGYAIFTYTPGSTTAGQAEVYLEVLQLEDRL